MPKPQEEKTAKTVSVNEGPAPKSAPATSGNISAAAKAVTVNAGSAAAGIDATKTQALNMAMQQIEKQFGKALL